MDGWTQRNAVGRREQTVITQSFCCHPPSFFPLPPEVLSAVPVSSTPRAVDRVAGTLGTGEAQSRSFSLPLTTCSSHQPPCRSTQGLRLCCPLYLESSPHRSPASLPLFLGSLFKCHLIKCHLPQPPREKGRPSFPTSCTSHPWPCCFSSSYSSPPDSLHVYFSTSCVFNIENSKNSIYFRLSCLLRASEDEHGCTWQSSGSCSLQGKRKTKHSCGDCQGPRMSPF